jgi:hypothetical protein
MEQTGERYTAARRNAVREAEPPEVGEPERRVSTEAVVAATGRPWEEWFALLDEWGAPGDRTARSPRASGSSASPAGGRSP